VDRTYLQTAGSAGNYQIFAPSIRKEFHWLSSVRQPNCTGTLCCRFKEQYCPNMGLPTLGYTLCLWPSRTISHKLVQNYDKERKGGAQFHVSSFRALSTTTSQHSTIQMHSFLLCVFIFYC